MGSIMKWLGGLFGPSVIKKQVGSLVRGLLRVMSGYLLSLGLAGEQIEVFTAAAEPVLIAVVMFAIAQAWSFIEKAQKAEE